MQLMEMEESLVGGYAPDFELPGTDGQVYHLGSYLQQYKAIGVVFLGNQCPYTRSYLSRLKAIQGEFAPNGFILIGINANDAEQSPGDTFEAMRQFVQEYELNFPYLRDPTQDVAQGFSAQKTPEVFLLDKNAVICYRGQIDDQPNSAEEVKKAYFANSIKALLEGETISPKFTETVGSPLNWRSSV